MIDVNEEVKTRLLACLSAPIAEDSLARLKKSVNDIIYEVESDIDYRLKDDLAPNLVCFVAEMAKNAVTSMLEGNEDQMRRYLGCERGSWTGRSDGAYFSTHRKPEDWHPVIHGNLFVTGAMKLRRDIVQAHADLIANERIKDLEDQVTSLVAQVNQERQKNSDLCDRLRQNGDY